MYLVQAREAIESAKIHRRGERSRRDFFVIIGPLLLVAILIGCGITTIILSLSLSSDGTAASDWIVAVVLGLALNWMILEPLVLAQW